MPVFVHLTSHRNLRSIRRGGIRAGRSAGVHALPVTRNFQISHQWLRELRRGGGGTVFGVYFRIRDDEPVEIGHYHRPHRPMTAAEAVAVMLEAESNDPGAARVADSGSRAIARGRVLPSSPEGFEVLIPRPIAPAEILRVKALPQVVGWRYRPGANGAAPSACLWAERGVWGIRRLERAVERAEAAGRPAPATLFTRDQASFRRVERLRRGRG
ncbi:MAG TPA: hypothetical protein VF547_09065 [Allosphingosinicella sp.]|jgi:hypothetical protein